MAVSELSRVTVALTTFLRQAILARGNVAGDLTVTGAPPQDETVDGEQIISVYMFHVVEDPYVKNLTPQQIQGDLRLRQAPIGLVVNFVVTARFPAGTTAGDRVLREQMLLGEVAATVHEHPELNDETQFPPAVPVFQTAGISDDDNRIQLVLRPVQIDETVNFWSSEQDLTARLSVFLEARVIQLVPPLATVVPGIVLSLGNFVFTGGRPRLDASRSVVGFSLPPGAALADPTDPVRRLAASPARASLFPSGALPAPLPGDVQADNNRLQLSGSDLTGERMFLLLTGPVEIDGGALEQQSFRLAIDRPDDNPDWAIEPDGQSITLGVRRSAVDPLGRSVELSPGVFRASFVASNQRSATPGAPPSEETSNELIFTVAPQVVSITAAGGPPTATRFDLLLFGFVLNAAMEVGLDVAGAILARSAGLTAGTFDFTDGTSTVTFVIDITTVASPTPVRLRIDGASSTPAWAVF